MDTQDRIGKDRLDKGSIDKGRGEEESSPPPNSKTYGEFQNVNLSDEEYQRLKEKLKSHTNTMIEKLSRYMQRKQWKDPIKTTMQPCFTGMRKMRKNCERKQMIEAKLPTIERI